MAVLGEEGSMDVDGVSASPPLKKMRGSLPGPAFGNRNDPTLPFEGKDVNSWVMVPYLPPVNSESLAMNEPSGRKFLPKPNAVRDCPPGMRIRGGRDSLTRKAAPKPVGSRKWKPLHVRSSAKPGNVNARADPVVVLSDSDSEPDRKAGHAPKARSVDKGKALEKKLPVSRGTKRPRTVDTSLPSFESTAPELSSSDPRTRVRFVLKQFDNLRRLFATDEEIRAKNSVSTRADFAASHMLNGYRVNGGESIYGSVPGVEVGDHYYYRAELLLISLHRQVQAGIDYIPASKSRFKDRNGNAVAIAVCVCASGGYEDDKDEGDTLIYTGQGGNNYKGDKRQGLDQELTRGNLGLKNCYELGLSVRVIRGNEYKRTLSHQSPSGKVYYYDGMYDVVDCYQEKGSAGFMVWKFKLVRQPNQGPLSSNLVLFRGKTLPPELKERGERILSEDLSNGLEPVKVRVVGCLEDDRLPENFQYISSLRLSPGLPKPSPPSPCPCDKECSKKSCSCIRLNGDQPYNEEGALLRAKKLVYECGPHCHCRSDSKCINRVTQKGLRFNLEVFKTEGKGWGLRCSSFIPQGNFVCEYIGEIIHESDAEKRVSNDEYMFDLKIPDSMERRFGDVSNVLRVDKSDGQDDDDDDDPNCQKYTVDANRFGNLARFINHSCDPNLFVQCVLYDHHDHRFPHIMLFASEHIRPYTELTYDYGYELNNIKVNGKIKIKNCYCGARKCRGRLY